MTRFPKFNRGVYLESKAKIGSVDEILGPLNAFYFSVIPAEGVNPASFKADQVFYMNPEDLLSTDRFTRPQAQKPKGPRREGGARPATGGFRPQGGRGDGNFRGQPRGRGNFGGRGQFNRR
jgi:H/ACA ribonucleoprotein complex subunit 1